MSPKTSPSLPLAWRALSLHSKVSIKGHLKATLALMVSNVTVDLNQSCDVSVRRDGLQRSPDFCQGILADNGPTGGRKPGEEG